ncbi:MAG: hypothetical protein QGG40_16240, partial [Myxococcota bacterium]|nr:hypothetical protein [Myxococcota bacterium]
FYVQLSDGAGIHQPNPASDGDTVTITAWMRGAADGDQATVTLDFRDQTMWTTPLQSEEESFTLSTSWEPVSFSATAPTTDDGNPVFHTRVTFQAGEDSTVDLDTLVMTTE